MSKLEEKSRTKVNHTVVQEAILETIRTIGVIGIALLAPNVIGALHKTNLLPHSRESEVVKSAASRLIKKGFLDFKEGHYTLTNAGERILKDWQRADYRIKRPRKWDTKWRVIIFDIPEKKRAIRTEVRQILIEAGFKRLQDSVWVYPYDCEDVIGLMKTDFGIGKDMLYMIVDQIENDKHLRQEFDLF
ncbi:MAG: CRISPR-associated endonuclease Cas2 [Candidatus Zambryskibacteria bacterium]|nr:CRISPR-associated endonuclease Cas2 [Candidatus Zambryskibacteria bacterium]